MRAFIPVLLLVAGCATVPDASVTAIPIGEQPTREAGIAAIETALKARLKDPDSAQFTWPAGFVSGWYQAPFDRRYEGWITCGTVNARNSYGGYVGRAAVVGVIRSGTVVKVNMDDANARYGSFVAEACKKIIGAHSLGG